MFELLAIDVHQSEGKRARQQRQGLLIAQIRDSVDALTVRKRQPGLPCGKDRATVRTSHQVGEHLVLPEIVQQKEDAALSDGQAHPFLGLLQTLWKRCKPELLPPASQVLQRLSVLPDGSPKNPIKLVLH